MPEITYGLDNNKNQGKNTIKDFVLLIRDGKFLGVQTQTKAGQTTRKAGKY
jgi:hypothetical protein